MPLGCSPIAGAPLGGSLPPLAQPLQPVEMLPNRRRKSRKQNRRGGPFPPATALVPRVRLELTQRVAFQDLALLAQAGAAGRAKRRPRVPPRPLPPPKPPGGKARKRASRPERPLWAVVAKSKRRKPPRVLAVKAVRPYLQVLQRRTGAEKQTPQPARAVRRKRKTRPAIDAGAHVFVRRIRHVASQALWPLLGAARRRQQSPLWIRVKARLTRPWTLRRRALGRPDPNLLAGTGYVVRPGLWVLRPPPVGVARPWRLRRTAKCPALVPATVKARLRKSFWSDTSRFVVIDPCHRRRPDAGDGFKGRPDESPLRRGRPDDGSGSRSRPEENC